MGYWDYTDIPGWAIYEYDRVPALTWFDEHELPWLRTVSALPLIVATDPGATAT